MRLPANREVVYKKALALFFGIIFSFMLLEFGLRTGGCIFSSLQESKNRLHLSKNGTYRILCLGESTTAGQYPCILEEILNRSNMDVRFSVVDKGMVSANSADILSKTESYLEEYHPDLVVAMMGCNDKQVAYYKDIPGPDVGASRHLRTYRLARLVYRSIQNKIGKKGIYSQQIIDKDVPSVNSIGLDLGKDLEYLTSVFSFRDENRFLQAEELFKKAAGLNPRNGNIYVALALLYSRQKKFLQAENAFKEAVKIDPKNDNVYIGLGWLYLDQYKLAGAESYFKKARELNPKNYTVYFALGCLYGEQGKLPEATNCFKKAITLSRKASHIYLTLGHIYQQQIKPIHAENAFKKAIEVNPANTFAHFTLGCFYRDQKNLAEAEKHFKKTLELDPKGEYANYVYPELGWIYYSQGKFTQAEEVLKTAIESNPKNDNAYAALSFLYEKTGRTELAKECAGKLKKVTARCLPATVSNYLRLKEILDRRGVRLACVQYPMRSIEPLKDIFRGREGSVIFIDNEKVFKEAVGRDGYKAYFLDMFGGNFGHCTNKGNRLLAENIAQALLKEVFKDRRIRQYEYRGEY